MAGERLYRKCTGEGEEEDKSERMKEDGSIHRCMYRQIDFVWMSAKIPFLSRLSLLFFHRVSMAGLLGVCLSA